MNIKEMIAQRKQQIVQSAGSVSDSTLNELARDELAVDSIKEITRICDKLDKMLKTSGVVREWSTPPKYEYGPVNGMIAKFITQWVYLPDALKQLSELNVPVTAFTADSVQDWGKLTTCTPLGVINSAIEPNLESVAIQIEKAKVYLNLDYVDPCLTQQEWKLKNTNASNRATKKQAEIESAILQDELDKELGLPSFTV